MKIKQTARYYGQGYAQVLRTVSTPIPDPVLGTITVVHASGMSLNDGVDYEGLHRISLCHPLDNRGVVGFERNWLRARRMSPERYEAERKVSAAGYKEGGPVSLQEMLYQRCARGCF